MEKLSNTESLNTGSFPFEKDMMKGRYVERMQELESSEKPAKIHFL